MRAHILYGRRPFGSTPAADLAAALQAALGRRRIVAGIAEIPVSPESELGELRDLLVAQSLRFGESQDDVMVALGYPAHLMRHPRCVVWMADLGPLDRAWGPGSAEDGFRERDPRGKLERQQAWSHSARYAVSAELAEALQSLGGESVEVLHPPEESDHDGWNRVVDRLLLQPGDLNVVGTDPLVKPCGS